MFSPAVENISQRHVTPGLVVPVEVVVFNEVGDDPLQLAREFIRDLVHFPCDGLVIALQLPVGLRMEGRRQDVPNTSEAQAVPEGSKDITDTVVREQFGAILNRYFTADLRARGLTNFLS